MILSEKLNQRRRKGRLHSSKEVPERTASRLNRENTPNGETFGVICPPEGQNRQTEAACFFFISALPFASMSLMRFSWLIRVAEGS